MTDTAIQVDQVWKKFRKGELHDSLRDLIPAIGRRLIGRAKKDELKDREFWALRDVSFEVKRGESLGIIGPNGAGKSTMLKLLSRIIRPNRGTYRVNGRLSALIEVGSGFHQDLSGRENIYLNGTILGMKRAEIRAKEEAIIDFAGVEDFIDTPVKRYSSGMKARLGFSVAAHMDPEVLLVDEVLSVGDARFRNKCIRHMKDLIQGEATVVFISHQLEQVRWLCPRTIVLDRGRTIYDGQTEGAIKVYLDALSDAAPGVASTAEEVEIRNVRLCDADGREVVSWTFGQPAILECDVLVRKPVPEAAVQVNVSALGGAHVLTANSRRRGFLLPQQPGHYPLRIVLDPLPLADGDYLLDLQVFGRRGQCLWGMRQARTVHMHGGVDGGIIHCDGQWELLTPAEVPQARPA